LAPDCSAAKPTVSLLWPANHRLVPVGIKGVTDPNNDPISIRMASIFQDEPTNTSGNPSFAIDGFGVASSQAQLRAERAGRGDGRVYHVRFSATDPAGLSCSGEVTVGVPHDNDRDRDDRIVDEGPLFDSTKAFPAVWHERDDRDHDRSACTDDQHDHRRDDRWERDR
jgi:hypothetical protein